MAQLARFGLVLAAVLALSIAVTIGSGKAEAFVFNPPYLLLALNLVFWTIATCVIAYVSAKSYLKEGTPVVLLLGNAVLIFGLANIVSSWAQNISGNFSLAIGNSCLAVSATLQVIAGVAASSGVLEGRLPFNRKAHVAATYVGSASFIVAFSALVFSNVLPPFFVAGQGPTFLRQVVLGTAVLLLAVAFLIFLRQYLKSRVPGLLWYSVAVGLMSLGLYSAFETKQIGDAVTWLARITLYVASFFLLAAVLRPGLARNNVHAGLAQKWAAAFMPDRRQFTTFFANMLNAFAYCKILTDENGKPVDCVILDVNEAYERVTGIKRENTVGKRLTEILPEVQNDPTDWIGVWGRVALTGEPVRFESYMVPMKKWYGVSVYSPQKGYFVAIFEDITERKKAEALLKDVAEKYASLFNTTSDGVWINNLKSEILEVNDAYCRMSGYAREELVGMTVDRLEAFETPAETIAHMKKVLESGGHDRFESRHRRKDGSVFDVDITALYLEREGGRIAIFVRDITERRKIEDSLRESRKKFQDLIETTADFVWEMDAQGRYTYCSPQMEKLWGLKPADMVGKTPFDVMPPADRERAMEFFKNTVSPAKPFSGLETTAYNSKHQLVFVESSGVPFSDDHGRLLGFRGITRDITERKKAENELRETRNYLENLLNYANAPIIVWDREFRITLFNHAFEHLTGLSASSVAGQRLDILFPEDRKEQSMAYIKRTVEGEFLETVEIPIQSVDGSVKTVLWNSANIYDVAGRDIVATIAQGQDITARKQMQAKVEEYAKNLEKIVEERTSQLKDSERLAAIGQTAGMVGHDIRNPLQAITSDIYLVKTDLASMPESEEKKSMQESLEEMGKNVDYINKIVADLQDYARQLKPTISKISLGSIIRDLVKKHGVPRHVRVHVKLGKQADTVMADPDFLKRILSNLVANAVQAMPQEGELTICTYRETGRVVVTVEDTGVGIPDEIKPKLFTPLFTTKSKGQGFGLAVVKRMTEAINGTINFESEVGKGTKFTIELPPADKSHE
ncbi:MAG: PAS domain S-box protein [Candidatus Bathyarchaeia archaeon]